jgi:hypothetical protein
VSLLDTREARKTLAGLQRLGRKKKECKMLVGHVLFDCVLK